MADTLKYDPNTGQLDTSFWNSDQWQKFGAAGGTIGKNNELLLNGTRINSDGTPIGLGGSSWQEYMNQNAFGGIGGLTKGGLQDIGMGANLLGTGYDLYSNLFGDKHDMFKTQMGALKQNMANIAQDRANHQTYVNNIGGGFNSAFGKGLAASAATKL
jgi:hypothetical protein